MAGLLDLFGGDASQPGAVYGGLLTPQQNSALAYRGLLAAAGALGQAAMPSRMPIPIGAALGQAAAAMGTAQDASGENALKGMLVGLQGKNLESQLNIRNQLLPIAQQILNGSGGAAAAPAAAGGMLGSPAPNANLSGVSDPRGKIPVIRAAALKYGIDPNVAVTVARTEGLGDFLGDNGKSGGAFQLYTGGGLGNDFEKDTGLNPLDPKNEDATIDYAMKHAAQNGWGAFHGAAKAGIPDKLGIGAIDNTYGIPAIAGSMPKLPTQVAQANTGTMSDALPLSSAAAGGPGTAGLLPSVNPAGNAGASGIPTAPTAPQGLLDHLNAASTSAAPPTSLLPPQMAAAPPAAPAPQGMLPPQPPQVAQAAPPVPAPAGAPGMSVGGMGMPQPPNINPRALAAGGLLAGLGGMPDVFKPLESYYYQSPGYIAQKTGAEHAGALPYVGPEAAAKAWAEVAPNIYTKMNTPMDLRTNGLGVIPSTGQIIGRNPAVPEGYTVGGTATNPIAEEIPGAISGISKVEQAKKGGGYQAEFGAVPGVQFTGNAADLSQPQPAPQTKPIATPQGTQLPPISEQFMPQSPGELEHAIPAWQKKTDEWNAGIAPARQAEMRLGTIAEAFKLTETGAFATHKAELATILKSIGIDPSLAGGTDPSAVQMALHDNILTTLPLLKAATPRPSQIEFMSVSENREHPNLQPAANLRMLTEDLALVRQAQQLPADWNAAQQQGWRNPQSFETAWSRLNPLDATRTQVEKEIGPLKGMQPTATQQPGAPRRLIWNPQRNVLEPAQ